MLRTPRLVIINIKIKTRFFSQNNNFIGDWRSKIKQMRRDVTNVEASILRKETLESSQKVVALAIGSNLIMFSGKLYAASVTQSYSMFSEALHSLADVLNECLLMIGIHRSLRRSDRDHPYGFTMERYAWALVFIINLGQWRRYFLSCNVN